MAVKVWQVYGCDRLGLSWRRIATPCEKRWRGTNIRRRSMGRSTGGSRPVKTDLRDPCVHVRAPCSWSNRAEFFVLWCFAARLKYTRSGG